jgi:hypothetical protein
MLGDPAEERSASVTPKLLLVPQAQNIELYRFEIRRFGCVNETMLHDTPNDADRTSSRETNSLELAGSPT